MAHSSTVENYLKALYQAQAGREDDRQLVPMGQLAGAVGVVPGTATTMVKALAESGLVSYEPYAGVRLTAPGRKLAALVLRRHRLIELFLVQILGMGWAEVHDEAERLEHAASDQLIERIDQMLGHPSVDPHGDPIPGPEGTVARREYHNLLTCPLRTPVVVTRVTDQDPRLSSFPGNQRPEAGAVDRGGGARPGRRQRGRTRQKRPSHHARHGEPRRSSWWRPRSFCRRQAGQTEWRLGAVPGLQRHGLR